LRDRMVIGCKALELREGCVRLHALDGSANISWSEITAAALAMKDRDIVPVSFPVRAPYSLPGPLAQLAEEGRERLIEDVRVLRESHDILWIICGTSQVRALIERTGDERESLLAALQQRLGDRWLGDQFSSADLVKRFGYRPLKQNNTPLYVAAAFAALAIMFIIVMRVAQLIHVFSGK
jgi:hypothetical protein